MDQTLTNRNISIYDTFFHVFGLVNRHIVQIWRCENPHAFLEHVSDSPKINLFGVPLPVNESFALFYLLGIQIHSFSYREMLNST